RPRRRARGRRRRARRPGRLRARRAPGPGLPRLREAPARHRAGRLHGGGARRPRRQVGLGPRADGRRLRAGAAGVRGGAGADRRGRQRGRGAARGRAGAAPGRPPGPAALPRVQPGDALRPGARRPQRRRAGLLGLTPVRSRPEPGRGEGGGDARAPAGRHRHRRSRRWARGLALRPDPHVRGGRAAGRDGSGVRRRGRRPASRGGEAGAGHAAVVALRALGAGRRRRRARGALHGRGRRAGTVPGPRRGDGDRRAADPRARIRRAARGGKRGRDRAEVRVPRPRCGGDREHVRHHRDGVRDDDDRLRGADPRVTDTSPLTPLSDDARLLVEAVRTLARERIAPRAAEVDHAAEFPWDAVELLRENDVFALAFPEEYGGTGTGMLTHLQAVEELSWADATVGLLLAVQGLGGLPVLLDGSEEQRQLYLPKWASGEWIAAYALTEPGAGSDAGALATRARREGD